MTCPVENNLCRRRGDNYPFQFQLKDSAGVVVDITGASFRLVIDPNPDPSDASGNLVDLNGVIVDAAQGQFEFRPTTGNMDITPDVYFYEVEMTDNAGLIRTVGIGQLEIQQDIAK